MGFDYKHIIAVVVGLVLGIVSAHFGIDFSTSCPPAPLPVVGKVQ